MTSRRASYPGWSCFHNINSVLEIWKLFRVAYPSDYRTISLRKLVMWSVGLVLCKKEVCPRSSYTPGIYTFVLITLVLRIFIPSYPRYRTPDMHTLVPQIFTPPSYIRIQQISNWAQRPLTQRQLNYAALDAYIILDVYKEVTAHPAIISGTSATMTSFTSLL